MKATIPSADETRQCLHSPSTAPMRPDLWSGAPLRPPAERRGNRPTLWMLRLFAAWAVIGSIAALADSRSGGNVILTAESYDAGGAPNGGGSVVNLGSLGGVGGQSTGIAFTVNGGYPAQVPGPTPPTAAALLSFSARWVGPAEVALEWQTGVEFDLLGFHLERQEADGGWRRISSSLIPTAAGGLPHHYDLVDANVPAGSQGRYRLLELNLFGQARVAGEAVVQVGLRSAIARAKEGLSITVQGRTGRAMIETATDVARGPWLPAGELTLDADGHAVLEALPLEDVSARFYRVRQ